MASAVSQQSPNTQEPRDSLHLPPSHHPVPPCLTERRPGWAGRAAHQLDAGPVSVRSGQVQRRVVAHVGDAHARAPLDQHLHYTRVAGLGRPVQRTEAVVVAETYGRVRTRL